jgi:hypothetical protein
MRLKYILGVLLLAAVQTTAQKNAVTVMQTAKGELVYTQDEKGNIIPDFSRVGYFGNAKPIPHIAVVKTVTPSGNDQQVIQAAIDEVSALPADKNGFRGAVLLKKGVYKIPGTIKINTSGVILRGEGEETIVTATGKGQRNLISVAGKGDIKATGEKINITDKFVPVGAKSFSVGSTANLHVGDKIIVYRPGTEKWIHDLQMDRIDARDSATKQWEAKEFDLLFERVITKIEKNKIYIDDPIVMQMEEQYGGGQIFTYSFTGRIQNVGIENLNCESVFASDTAEDHGWNAVHFNRIENGWVRNVTSRYFGYSCVNLGNLSKNITVDSCKYLQPKSQITGGRRYSFNNDGQLNLIKNCFASEGRHDYVTGARVCGPNVFYNCRSENAKADIGPHHRWAVGTLYDNIITDGEINMQDRGNWGTGHGWSGITQIIWNCTAAKAVIQDPWVSGKNYVFGLKAKKVEGRLKGRTLTVWSEAPFKSLYEAQLNLKMR